MGMPRLTFAVALFVLAALTATMTYTGFLVVGVLADYFGTSRFITGLLIAIVFARFPWIRDGKPRMVGLLPKPLRRPLVLSALALCLLRFVTQGDTVPAWFAGCTMAVILVFPWLWKVLFARMSSSIFNIAPRRHASAANDDTVIEGEFRERKE